MNSSLILQDLRVCPMCPCRILLQSYTTVYACRMIEAEKARTVVDAGDVDELLPGALLHGLQRRGVPRPLGGVAARPSVGRRRHRCSGHLFCLTPVLCSQVARRHLPFRRASAAGSGLVPPPGRGKGRMGRWMEKRSCSLTHPTADHPRRTRGDEGEDG